MQKSKQAKVFFCLGKQRYPFTNLRIVYLVQIRIAWRMQTLCSRLLCHDIHQKERKKGPIWQRGGGQAIWAMPAWTDHFSKRGFPDCKGPQFWNGQKKIKSFQFPGEKENWMRERDLPGQPKLVWDPMNIPTKFLPRKGILCLSSKTFASNLVGEHD